MGKKILLVEDEKDISDAIAEALTTAGYEVSTAENGQAGLKLALEEHPDLILLDLMMPVMDGHETLNKLREDQWGRKAKVIVLTAMDDMTNIATAHEFPITDYIIKAQASLDEILKKIRIHIVE
jgi:DNA-binding response OmpR family regulator